MDRKISNAKDIIDSRDVIARIEALETSMADNPDDWTLEQGDELKALRALAADAEPYAPDWEYGATLIRDTYFEEYAQELAEECGMIPADAQWPANCIDWEEAARQLQQDYTAVDFDGVRYLIR